MGNLIFSFKEFTDSAVALRDIKDFKFDTAFESEIDVFLEAKKITESSLYMKGEVKGAVSLECSRCLVKYTHPIFLKVDMEIEFEKAIVDMGEHLRQLVILELPIKPLCNQDCLGICQKCGNINKKYKACSCNFNDEDKDFIRAKWKGLNNI